MQRWQNRIAAFFAPAQSSPVSFLSFSLPVTRAFLIAFIVCNAMLDGPQASGQVAVEEPSLVRIPATAMREQNEIDSIIREGRQLEAEQRWRDAIDLYEDGWRRFNNDHIRQRLDVVRSRFDFERRYRDEGYLRMLGNQDRRVAANVLAEVLLKIDAYHVDRPDWAAIARRGTESLIMSVDQQVFRNAALPANSRVSTDQVIQELQTLYRSRTYVSRQDVRDLARDIDDTLRQRFGMASNPIYYEFACSSLASLDWYSSFLTAEQYDDVISQIDGNFVGLGIELQPHEDNLEIVAVIPNGPAGEAGLRSGDRIVAIDQTMVEETGGDPAADRLRGPEGSMVDLLIDPINGQRQTIRIRRRRVEIPSLSKAEIIDRQNGVAYIQLTAFQRTTAVEFRNALWELHRDGMRSLIVDVRGNPGGLLDASVDVANLFLTQGTIVSTRGRNPVEDRVRSANFEGTWQVPLTVLIDSNSASASEIFAGAIRDHQRGTLIGETSYGKGSVQGIFPLNANGGGIRLTTAKFFSPVGQAISPTGVKPHMVVQTTSRPDFVNDNRQSDEDPVLAAAIRNSVEQQR